MENENAVDRAYKIVESARLGAISYDDASWLWEYIIALEHTADSYAQNWSRAERRIVQMQEIIEDGE